MLYSISTFFIGFLFAIGLGVSGMTKASSVKAFLDVFGDWNAALVLVMIGAILVHVVLYKLIIKKPKPLLEEKFMVPNKKNIDKKLIFGAMIFGLGWGVVGFCPAPAIVSLVTLSTESILFVVSMLLGMFLFNWSNKLLSKNI